MAKQKRILYATTNPSKVVRMQEILRPFSLEILNLIDFGQTEQIHEDGRTPEANAIKKARYHFERVGIPTLAVDAGLTIERFPSHLQPGNFVRRIYGTDHQASDDELLDYYAKTLESYGGQSKGLWITSLALMVSSSKIHPITITSETKFVAKKSPVVMPGEPLNSLQVDPVSGKYFSEMTAAQRVSALKTRTSGIFDFFQEHWHEI